MLMPTISASTTIYSLMYTIVDFQGSWTCIPTYPPTHLPTYLPACRLPNYLPTYLPTYIHTYIHTEPGGEGGQGGQTQAAVRGRAEPKSLFCIDNIFAEYLVLLLLYRGFDFICVMKCHSEFFTVWFWV